MKWLEIKQPGFYAYVDDDENLHVENRITIANVVKYDDDDGEFSVWWIGCDQDSLVRHYNGDFYGPIELDNYLLKIWEL